MLHEKLHFDPAVIEHQPSHQHMGTASTWTKLVEERRAMMQEWADYLDTRKAGADVIPLPHRA